LASAASRSSDSFFRRSFSSSCFFFSALERSSIYSRYLSTSSLALLVLASFSSLRTSSTA
jgi:hypothetical protein